MLQDKIKIWLAYFMQFLIFISIIISLFTQEFFYTLAAAVALIITFLPAMIRRRWKITLPWTLNLLIVISLYLYAVGLVFGLYGEWYPFYDKFGHFLGSIVVAFLGFASVIIVDKYSDLNLNKRHIILFIIVFTMAIGSFWEIFEFFFDQLLSRGSQSGLDDTMYDMIFNFFGASLIAIITNINFRYMKESVLEHNR